MADTDRTTVWVLAATAVYVLMQALLRTVLGGTLEVDEAELLVMSQDWAWGYGPQFPLYNWAQVLVFQAMGPGAAGLALLKAAVLWLAVAGMWFAMRAAFADWRAALAATLSLAFLPNVIWEFQRASSHSIAMLAATTWTLWAWFRLMQRQGTRQWLLLGLIVGLGGLSKVNYWAVPVGLAVASIGFWRQSVDWVGAARAVGVAAAIVALPYGWIWANPDQGLASVTKFYQPEVVALPWLTGLGGLLGSVVAALALAALIWVAVWVAAARGMLGGWTDAGRILLRAGALALVAAVVMVVAFQVTKIQARWLVPVYIVVTAAAFARLGAALSPRAFRVLPVLAALCGAVTLAGMVQIRLEPGRTATLDLTPLSDLVTRLAPDRIEADYFLAGNLELLDPARDTAPWGALARKGVEGRVLSLGPVQDLPTGVQVLEAGRLELPYPGRSDKIYPVEWQLLGHGD